MVALLAATAARAQIAYEVRDGYYVVAADGASRFDAGDCARQARLGRSTSCPLTIIPARPLRQNRSSASQTTVARARHGRGSCLTLRPAGVQWT